MLKTDNLTSLKEASEKIGISYRMARYYAKQYSRDIVMDGKFIYVTERWFKKVKHNRSINSYVEPRTKKEILNDISRLENELKEKDNTIAGNKELLDKATTIKKQLEATVKELTEELQQYEIEENERIEVFTNEEYAVFQERLIEWREQRKELELKDKHFEAEKKSNEELIEHYKNLYDYQRKQSERILDMHQKLIDSIGLQLQHVSERNLIEAVEKKVIKRDDNQ